MKADRFDVKGWADGIFRFALLPVLVFATLVFFAAPEVEGADVAVPLAQGGENVRKPTPPRKPENNPPPYPGSKQPVKPGHRPKPGEERPTRPPGPPPHRPNRPHGWRPGWGIYVVSDDNYNQNNQEFPMPTPPNADGTIFIVSASPENWERNVDIASNTFEMKAGVSLYSDMPKSEISGVRAVFNQAVDRKSVPAELDEEGKRMAIRGKIASGHSVRDVELLQIILELVDGRVYVQNLHIGLEQSP